MSVNILAYADDIVLLSLSWRGLQLLIDTLFLCVKDINMLCNGRKLYAWLLTLGDALLGLYFLRSNLIQLTYKLCLHFAT